MKYLNKNNNNNKKFVWFKIPNLEYFDLGKKKITIKIRLFRQKLKNRIFVSDAAAVS